MRRITAESGLSVRLMGPADGQPVVLLHGFLADARQWQGVASGVDAARGRRHRWILPDLPGHGASAGWTPTGEPWPALIQALLQTLGELTPEPWMLGGYSMGGRVAAVLASTHPSAIRALWLESPQPPMSSTELSARLHLDEERAQAVEKDLRGFVHEWEALPLFASQRELLPSAARHQRRLRLSQDGAGLARNLRWFGTATMPRPLILPMPVHFLAGERDAGVVSRLPDWRVIAPSLDLHVESGAGHAVHLDHPAAAIRSICRWLDIRADP